RVELEPGRYVKMYEQDAIEAGHIKPKRQEPAQEKQRRKVQDKQRLPAQDKAAEPELEPEAEAADFTVIEGVGKATARALAANGVTTFDELQEAGELDYLSAGVNAAIEAWRNGG